MNSKCQLSLWSTEPIEQGSTHSRLGWPKTGRLDLPLLQISERAGENGVWDVITLRTKLWHRMIEAAITVKNWIKWEFDPDSEKWENRYRRTIELSSCSSDHNPDCIVWLSWQLNLPRQMVKFLPDHMTMNHSSQHECLNLILDLRTDSSLGLRWYRYPTIYCDLTPLQFGDYKPWRLRMSNSWIH